eukprot:jgi/Chlat1/7143/Chrsp57S06803
MEVIATYASKPEIGPSGLVHGAVPTLQQIEDDALTKIARENWPVGAKERPAFKPAIVETIYKDELSGKINLQRAMLLEISQYLENYLWPHFDPETATYAHVMSIILMINEKFRENVLAWDCFHTEKEKFPGFFKRVIMLKKGERKLSVREKTHYLSLEDEMVRTQVLRLVSLQLWHCLSPGRLQTELSASPQLEKHWRYLQKKEVKAKKSANYVPPSERPETFFIPSFIHEFLELLDTVVNSGTSNGGSSHEANGSYDGGGNATVQAASLLYCERFVEFMVDLLSQLPTRRFVHVVVEDLALVVKCRMSSLHAHPRGRLFQQLVDLLRFYQGFEINDHTGMQLKQDEMESAHCERILSLQRLTFKKYPELRDLALSNVGSIEKRATLMKYLDELGHDELHRLAIEHLHLLSPTDPWGERDEFLKEVLVSTFERRVSQKHAINMLPLYPNEEVLWDENVVPSIHYTGENALALPKLNLQFLTFYDYLLRNFNLFRLEATYEIREDIQDVVKRVNARVNEEDKVVFNGWARMAIPIAEYSIAEVKKPNIGEMKPAAVTANIKIDLKRTRGLAVEEWNAIKEHDVLFLLVVRPPEWIGAPAGQTFCEQFGILSVRGCEVIELKDEENNLMNDFSGRTKPDEWKPPKGSERTVVVAMDTAQYQMDMDRMAMASSDGHDIYTSFNLLVRRKPKENNFKAILESIRDLMNEEFTVPEWLHDIFLGYGDPAAAQYSHMPADLLLLDKVDFKDTFLDANHLTNSFPNYTVQFKQGGKDLDADGDDVAKLKPPFRVTFPPPQKAVESVAGAKRKGVESENGSAALPQSNALTLIAEPYMPPHPGPYPQDVPPQNTVRFTPVQVEAIRSGVQPGLTMVVGPPGTGKTDVAVQIMHVLYHNFPGQRTLVITHSNQALNDLFEKIMQRDVPERYMLRLGMGEKELNTELDMSRQGRVNHMLSRRLELLAEVERMAQGLNLSTDVSYTCETAAHFWLLHVLARWEVFLATVHQAAPTTTTTTTSDASTSTLVREHFPFHNFFSTASQPLFKGQSYSEDMRVAWGCFRHLKRMFTELEECRAFELLRTTADRSNYLMTKQAKIVAMTCTHAALKRRDFLNLAFKYDNLLMEESAQILEIETFIPMVLQKQQDNINRLKRVIMIGDHHQLPPVVKNMAFQKYSHLDQSLFTRFVRLGTPYIELNAQGRARPSLAQLYNWRYRELGDLEHDYLGKGEMEPTQYFYQNLGEAEYIVSVYQYMRILGYPSHKISILTTYNGQKHLIRDVIERRCAGHPLFGKPAKITTVDKFQGQQNDYILLSLVRTRVFGHLRDVRRLVVAMSRARLGLYVFCRKALFEQCYELQPTFRTLLARPHHLALVPGEGVPATRQQADPVTPVLVEGLEAMAAIVDQMARLWADQQQAEMHRRVTASQAVAAALAHAQSQGFAPNSATAGGATADGHAGGAEPMMEESARVTDADATTVEHDAQGVDSERVEAAAGLPDADGDAVKASSGDDDRPVEPQAEGGRVKSPPPETVQTADAMDADGMDGAAVTEAGRCFP